MRWVISIIGLVLLCCLILLRLRSSDLNDPNTAHPAASNNLNTKFDRKRNLATDLPNRKNPQRECYEAIQTIRSQLMDMERTRVVDHSSAVENLKVTEPVRRSFQVPLGIDTILMDVDFVVVEAPNQKEIEFIRDAIVGRLDKEPFESIRDKTQAGENLRQEFLNYPNKKKIVRRNRVKMIDGTKSNPWIVAYNTDEVMQLEGVSGITLSSKNFAGFERIKGGREKGLKRYAHLFSTTE